MIKLPTAKSQASLLWSFPDVLNRKSVCDEVLIELPAVGYPPDPSEVPTKHVGLTGLDHERPLRDFSACLVYPQTCKGCGLPSKVPCWAPSFWTVDPEQTEPLGSRASESRIDDHIKGVAINNPYRLGLKHPELRWCVGHLRASARALSSSSLILPASS